MISWERMRNNAKGRTNYHHLADRVKVEEQLKKKLATPEKLIPLMIDFVEI